MQQVKGIEPDWGVIANAVLSRWQDLPFDVELSETAEGFVDRAASVAPSLRPQFLMALRRRLGSVPLDELHPSWVASVLPEDPLLRLWVLGTLPRHIRRAVSREVTRREARVGCWSCEPPPWFAGWWRSELSKRLHFPLRLPGPIPADRPLDYLFLLKPVELERLLATFGLRSLAAGLRGLDPKKVVELVIALPRIVRARLTEVSRNSDLPAVDPWFDLLRHHLERETPIEDLPTYLALEDLGVQARALGRQDSARRLALRLPRRLGVLLQQRVEFGNESLVHRDPRAWEKTLHMDLADLVRLGLAVTPELDKEHWQ